MPSEARRAAAGRRSPRLRRRAAPTRGARGRLAAVPPGAAARACRARACAKWPAGGQALLRLRRSLSADQRGLVWLLAYEHHYRQQILAALAANHGRVPALPASARRSSCSAWTIARRARAATWRKSIRRSRPSAPPASSACRCSGRGSMTKRRRPSARSSCAPSQCRARAGPARRRGAHRRHRRARRLRLAWRERLHQGSRRGWLQAALLTVAAARLAPCSDCWRGRWRRGVSASAAAVARRDRFDRPLPGVLKLTAGAGEAARVASRRPRRGSASAKTSRWRARRRLSAQHRPDQPLRAAGGDRRPRFGQPQQPASCRLRLRRLFRPPRRTERTRVLRRWPIGRRCAPGWRAQGIVIPDTTTHFVGAEHNTCDESFVWYDGDQLPASHRAPFAALRARLSTRRPAGTPSSAAAASPRHRPSPSPARRSGISPIAARTSAQARPELGHATIAAAFRRPPHA